MVTEQVAVQLRWLTNELTRVSQPISIEYKMIHSFKGPRKIYGLYGASAIWKLKSQKSPCPVYNSRDKSVSPMQMIYEKSIGPVQSLMLKTQTVLVTDHFSNQLGSWGAVVSPPPLPPPQYKQGCAEQIRHIDLWYK